MPFAKYNGYVLLLVLVILILLVVMYFTLRKKEYFDMKGSGIQKVFRIELEGTVINYHRSLPLPITLRNALDDNVIVASDYHEADTIVFENLNNIEQVLDRIIFPVGVRYINAFKGIDSLANKATLSKFLKGTKCIPPSWVLSDPVDVELFKHNFSDKDIYVLKKNVQQQMGLKIVRGSSVEDVINHANGYVVCQRLLQNPFLVANRKVNLRVYMFVTIRPGKVPDFFAYEDGFVYYAQKPWQSGTTDTDINVTTGLMSDRSIYKTNPHTRKDFDEFIGPKRATLLQSNIIKCMKVIKTNYMKHLSTLNNNMPKGAILYQIFGVDIAPDQKLGATIMEINKGPELNYKDAKDREVKLNLMKSVIDYLNNIHTPPRGFTHF